MHFRALGISLLLLTSFTFAQGRKPAVEDFVGIEVEHPKQIPQGTEGLFNFEKDMNKFAHKKGKTEAPSAAAISQSKSTSWGTTTLFGTAIILGLPLLSWLLVINHLRRQAKIESASNIEVLEKYRKERELLRKQDQDFKKVS